MKTVLVTVIATLFCFGNALGDEATQKKGPLPKFNYQGVALHPKNLTITPASELERASIIKMEGRIKNPLAKYYLYYSPHKHVGMSLAYSDSIEGPWTEYKGNPIINDAAIPDIRWFDATATFHLWGHQKNKQSEMWTSKDGLNFEYHSTSIAAKNIGTRNATYTRAYVYPLERYGSKYIMLYSGFDLQRQIRCVWLAYSKDGKTWSQEKTPLIDPIEGENKDIYGPSLFQWQGRNFIVYQDHTAYRGGNVKYVELDKQLNPVGDKGERFVLIDPVPDSPIGNRYGGCEFYREGDTIYMFASGGDEPRAIVYATAKVGDADTQSPRKEGAGQSKASTRGDKRQKPAKPASLDEMAFQNPRHLGRHPRLARPEQTR